MTQDERVQDIVNRIRGRMKTPSDFCTLLKEFKLDESKASLEYGTISNEGGRGGLFKIGTGTHSGPIPDDVQDVFRGMSKDESDHLSNVLWMLKRLNCDSPGKEFDLSWHEPPKRRRYLNTDDWLEDHPWGGYRP